MDSPEPLLSRTYRLLAEAELSYKKIADGSGLSKNWIAKLCQGAIKEPGVTKIQAVHDFLITRVAKRRPLKKRRGKKLA